jgi:hypothetical protein
VNHFGDGRGLDTELIGQFGLSQPILLPQATQNHLLTRVQSNLDQQPIGRSPVRLAGLSYQVAQAI